MSERIEGLSAILHDAVTIETITEWADWALAIGNESPTVDDRKMLLTEVRLLIAEMLKNATMILTNKSIDQDGAGNDITNIANASIKAAAAIALTKLAALTAGRVAVTNAGTGFLEVSVVTLAQLLLLSASEDNAVHSTGANVMIRVDGANQMIFQDGKLIPILDDDIDIGDGTHKIKDIHVDGVGYLDELIVNETATIRKFNFERDTGAADVYVVDLDPALPSYTEGMVLIFTPVQANTGACTINVNSLGAVDVKIDNAGALADPAAGDLDPDIMYMLIYDGTNFQLKNPT